MASQAVWNAYRVLKKDSYHTNSKSRMKSDECLRWCWSC